MNTISAIIIPTASGEPGFCSICEHGDLPCMHFAKDLPPFVMPIPKPPQVEGAGLGAGEEKLRRDPREHCE